jgi:hypothetical protein
MYRRTGTCNQCGECCGSINAPTPTNPYPKAWPEAIARWSLDDANEVCPQLTMFGISNQGDEIGYSQAYGSYSVQGSTFYYVWVPGVGCCKDTSAGHDGTSYNTECPFLDDATKACGLVGTLDEGARSKFCRHEEHQDFDPDIDIRKDLCTRAQRDQWQTRHPSCSYIFVPYIKIEVAQLWSSIHLEPPDPGFPDTEP